MDLRPPIRRSWLRLRLGKAYYTGKRYLLWCSPKYRWAKTRKEERLPCVQFSHATPLMRHLRGEEMVWQENKVTNLRLAVKRLDGLILYPGETFSYWKRIGKPTARKGYKEGMVLFLGQHRRGHRRRAVPTVQSDFLDDPPHAPDGDGALPPLP